jgi:hypothetical protein
MKELISKYFRARRFTFFKGILDKLLATGQKVKILDIGGTEDYWKSMGLALGENIEIVLLNLYENEFTEPGFKSIKGDACNLEGIEDKSFDLVFSNESPAFFVASLYCDFTSPKDFDELTFF